MNNKSNEYVQEIIKNTVFLIVSLWLAFGASDIKLNIVGLFLSGFFFIKGYKLNKKLRNIQKQEEKEIVNPENENT